MSWSIAIRDAAAAGASTHTIALVDRSSDIVEATREFFTPSLIRRIALHRRLSCDAVEQAIDLALPSLLAALANLAHRPLGAGILACALARQYPATLETIRNGIGNESQDVAAAYGSGYMAYLVGEPAFAGVSTDIAGASRLDVQETKLLVGLVGWSLIEPAAPGTAAARLERGRPCPSAALQLRQGYRGRRRQEGMAHCARRNGAPRSSRALRQACALDNQLLAHGLGSSCAFC